MIAKELKLESENLGNTQYATLIFVYNKTLKDKSPIVYSSINKALKSLSISHGTMMDCITNKFILKENLILSFEPLSIENFTEYNHKPIGDNLLRKYVVLYNEELEPAFEFNSAR